jgi:hypothetical protein
LPVITFGRVNHQQNIMNTIRISRHAQLFLGLIGASVVSFPTIAASAATLYVGDLGSNTIKTISATGVVTPFVTTGLNVPYALAFDASGNLFEADYGSNKINKISATGVVTTFATGLNQPAALAFGPDPVSTAVPEPFTMIGTLVGGSAAFRMRKKFKATNKL